MPTLTCSCGSSPGSIWRGLGSVQTRATAVNPPLLLWPLTKIWAGEKFWCPTLWRGWVGLPRPHPPALHPPSRPSRTRTLPVNIAIRSHGHITQRWSSGWWWRPDRGQSSRTAWEAQRNCWSGSSAMEACWRQKSPNQQAPLTRFVFYLLCLIAYFSIKLSVTLILIRMWFKCDFCFSQYIIHYTESNLSF